MKRLSLIAFSIFFLSKASAQSVAINTDGSTANASSILDVKSTAKGILIPRMSKAEKNTIAVPANGLLVYQNAPDSIGFYYYNGSSWVWLQNANNIVDWSINGNAGTDTSVNFLGTTTSMPLRFVLNNNWAGQWDERLGNYAVGLNANKSLQPPAGVYDARHNIAIGNNALTDNTSGNNNIAIGEKALKLNQTGYRNIAIGSEALSSVTSGDGLYAIGDGALKANTGGAQNYAIGQATLTSNTVGNFNIGIGYFSLNKNVDGGRNLAIGHAALANNVTGFDNLAIGYQALTNNVDLNNLAFGNNALRKNYGGYENIAIGNGALDSNYFGTNNIAVGYLALRKNINSINNVAVGSYALMNNESGSSNTAIGNNAGLNTISGSSNTFAGASAGYSAKYSSENVAVGMFSFLNDTSGVGNVAIGYRALVSQRNRRSNVAIGRNSLQNNGTDLFYRPYQSHEGINNIAIGENSMSLNKVGSNNIAIGYEAMSLDTTAYDNIAIGYQAGGRGSTAFPQTDNIFIGNFAGSASRSHNKLYIDNRYADSTAAFIYGDFNADSLRLNAALNVRDYTRLGTRAEGAPAIKTKKITGINGASGITTPFAHGLTQSKILSVSVFINATSGNDIPPRSTYGGFEYDYYVSPASVFIKNISGNDAAIAGRSVRILITYEE